MCNVSMETLFICHIFVYNYPGLCSGRRGELDDGPRAAELRRAAAGPCCSCYRRAGCRSFRTHAIPLRAGAIVDYPTTAGVLLLTSMAPSSFSREQAPCACMTIMSSFYLSADGTLLERSGTEVCLCLSDEADVDDNIMVVRLCP